MLTKTFKNLIEEEKTFTLPSGVRLYEKTVLSGMPGGKTAIYIHGGGSGGNHTIVRRPSQWMVDQGLFNRVIMPDRRGAANSSPITSMMTYQDNAQDMKDLLDAMGVHEKVTAIGISYGGPIALTLAHMDPRIDEVILVASSPSLKPAKGLVGFLYQKKLLDKIVAKVYKKLVGKYDEKYPDFDAAYDSKNIGDLKKIFADAIMHTPKERFESLLFENASTCDLDNQAISPDISLSVPIYRVIGSRDETWEVELGDTYKDRLTNIRTSILPGAGHKDVFFKASEFYDALLALYQPSKRMAV